MSQTGLNSPLARARTAKWDDSSEDSAHVKDSLSPTGSPDAGNGVGLRRVGARSLRNSRNVAGVHADRFARTGPACTGVIDSGIPASWRRNVLQKPTSPLASVAACRHATRMCFPSKATRTGAPPSGSKGASTKASQQPGRSSNSVGAGAGPSTQRPLRTRLAILGCTVTAWTSDRPSASPSTRSDMVRWNPKFVRHGPRQPSRNARSVGRTLVPVAVNTPRLLRRIRP